MLTGFQLLNSAQRSVEKAKNTITPVSLAELGNGTASGCLKEIASGQLISLSV